MRTNAPPLPGLTCWNSTIRKSWPSISMCDPFLNCAVLITARRVAAPAPARRSAGRVRRRVLGGVAGQQFLLALAAGVLEEDDRGADQDGGDAGEVGAVVAVEERLAGGADDLILVLRVLPGEVRGAGERLLELALDVLADLSGTAARRRPRMAIAVA